MFLYLLFTLTISKRLLLYIFLRNQNMINPAIARGTYIMCLYQHSHIHTHCNSFSLDPLALTTIKKLKHGKKFVTITHTHTRARSLYEKRNAIRGIPINRAIIAHRVFKRVNVLHWSDRFKVSRLLLWLRYCPPRIIIIIIDKHYYIQGVLN